MWEVGSHTHTHTHSLSCRELSGRELVAEMVFTFLLPEVEKQTLRQRGESGVKALTVDCFV